MSPVAPTVRQATSAADLDAVRTLFREYAAEFRPVPGFREALCLQGFEAELAALPGVYAPPAGALLLAFVEDEPAGCVAFKRLGDGVCEMKRLYVRPARRGSGAGRRLVETVAGEARRAGYRRMRLDTVPDFESATRLYRSCGFRDIPAYGGHPAPHTICLEKDLWTAGE